MGNLFKKQIKPIRAFGFLGMLESKTNVSRALRNWFHQENLIGAIEVDQLEGRGQKPIKSEYDYFARQEGFANLKRLSNQAIKS